MPKVYDTTFREMFSKGWPALLPWLLPGVSSYEVLKEDKDLATTSRWADLVLRVDRQSTRRPQQRTMLKSSSVIQEASAPLPPPGSTKSSSTPLFQP